MLSSAIEDSDMPKDTPFSVIFTVFWDQAGVRAYMNMVYTVALAREIRPALEYAGSVIEIGADEDLVIDASGSRLLSQTSGSWGSEGLSFRWECGPFQSYCDEWRGSQLLTLPSSVVLSQGSMDEYYTISVVISSISAGHDLTDESVLAFKKADAFIWTRSRRPEFVIAVPAGQIHVSEDEQISIDASNFRSGDEGYRYEFKLEPEDSYDQSLVQ